MAKEDKNLQITPQLRVAYIITNQIRKDLSSFYNEKFKLKRDRYGIYLFSKHHKFNLERDTLKTLGYELGNDTGYFGASVDLAYLDSNVEDRIEKDLGIESKLQKGRTRIVYQSDGPVEVDDNNVTPSHLINNFLEKHKDILNKNIK